MTKFSICMFFFNLENNIFDTLQETSKSCDGQFKINLENKIHVKKLKHSNLDN